MPNIIRIKRSTGSTPPTQLKNAELAFAEGTNILYIGRGTQAGTDIATEIVKVGGTGAFMTFDTNQAPTGVKTFSTTTFKLTGGTNGQILTTNGSGSLTWTSGVGDAYSSILGDVGGTITASGVAPTTPADGDIWNASGVLNFRVGATTKTALLNDSVLDGGSFS
jgi:hypothetical protein